jgi:hypothetical protein
MSVSSLSRTRAEAEFIGVQAHQRERRGTDCGYSSAAGAVIAATVGVAVAEAGHLYIANAVSFAVGIATGA